jgi:hypothetical protein
MSAVEAALQPRGSCCGCGPWAATNYDPLYTCYGCGAGGHRFCSGLTGSGEARSISDKRLECLNCRILNVASGSSRKTTLARDLRPLVATLLALPLRCVLCDQGAKLGGRQLTFRPVHFPKSKTFRWVHGVCHFHTEKFLEDESSEGGILVPVDEDKEEQLRGRYTNACVVCRKATAGCVPCFANQEGAACDAWIHPSCALGQEHEIVFDYVHKETDDSELGSLTYRGVCCAAHSSAQHPRLGSYLQPQPQRQQQASVLQESAATVAAMEIEPSISSSSPSSEPLPSAPATSLPAASPHPFAATASAESSTTTPSSGTDALAASPVFNDAPRKRQKKESDSQAASILMEISSDDSQVSSEDSSSSSPSSSSEEEEGEEEADEEEEEEKEQAEAARERHERRRRTKLALSNKSAPTTPTTALPPRHPHLTPSTMKKVASPLPIARSAAAAVAATAAAKAPSSTSVATPPPAQPRKIIVKRPVALLPSASTGAPPPIPYQPRSMGSVSLSFLPSSPHHPLYIARRRAEFVQSCLRPLPPSPPHPPSPHHLQQAAIQSQLQSFAGHPPPPAWFTQQQHDIYHSMHLWYSEQARLISAMGGAASAPNAILFRA